eukprot:6468741-Amphidinium_carterae.1
MSKGQHRLMGFLKLSLGFLSKKCRGLSTVKDSSIIYVLSRGVVVESGTHEDGSTRRTLKRVLSYDCVHRGQRKATPHYAMDIWRSHHIWL